MPNEMVFDEGLEVIADNIASSLATDWRLRLFKSNQVPAHDDLWADYTQADFSGYAQQALTNPVLSFDGGGLIESITWDEVIFESDSNFAGQICYGWLLVDLGSGAENLIITGGTFAPPQAVANIGDQIKVTPILRFKKGT